MKTLLAFLILASSANAALFSYMPQSDYFRSGGSTGHLKINGWNYGYNVGFSWRATPTIAVVSDTGPLTAALTELDYTMQVRNSQIFQAPPVGLTGQLIMDPLTTPGPRLVAPAAQSPFMVTSGRLDFVNSVVFELPESFAISGSLAMRVGGIAYTFPIAAMFTLADPDDNHLPLDIPLSLHSWGATGYLNPREPSPWVTYAPAAGSDFIQTVGGVPIELRWTDITLPIFLGGMAPEPSTLALAGIASMALRRA